MESARPQITRALIATGSRQFVHRDVKPSNVMLCTEADSAIVAKLINFGLVRGITEQFARATAGPPRQSADRTNQSHGAADGLVVPPARIGFIGTPHFASPEQFAGEKTDARSDIFSLGATLWFMLTGKLLFDGTRDAIRRKQISGTLPLDQLPKFKGDLVIDTLPSGVQVDLPKGVRVIAAAYDRGGLQLLHAQAGPQSDLFLEAFR